MAAHTHTDTDLPGLVFAAAHHHDGVDYAAGDSADGLDCESQRRLRSVLIDNPAIGADADPAFDAEEPDEEHLAETQETDPHGD